MYERRHLLPTAAAMWLAAGCQMIADFDPDRVAETTAAMCSDGEDNDANGLLDCQDWQCLDTAACCTRATLVIEERFDGYACSDRSCTDASADATCGAASLLDGETWETWGSPDPIVCDGGLTPNKQEQCYPVGARARVPLQLQPGLGVDTTIAGPIEPSAYATVGLTFQDQIVGDEVACVSIEPVSTALSIRLEAAGGGVRAIAVFQDREIGARTFPGTTEHVLRIEVGDTGSVRFLTDGIEIGRSPNVVLGIDRPVYPVLYGLGSSWRFEQIVVTESNRCDAPDGWVGTPRNELGPSESGFDSYEVRMPDVQRADDGSLTMYYVGCAVIGRPGCNRSTLAVGQATSANLATPFQRHEQPLIRFEGNLSLFDGDDMHIEVDSEAGAYLSSPTKIQTTSLDPTAGDDGSAGEVVIPRGPPGAWDAGDICCSSAVQLGNTKYLWYAARADDDPTWRIGLAVSVAGGPFEKSAMNPLLVEGDLDAHDGRGVSSPEVVYDAERSLYRMWYVADSFLGESSIAYAVSPDGITWHKYPDNPVLTSERAGLQQLGGPSILTVAGHHRLYFHAQSPDWYHRKIYSIDNVGQPLLE